MCSIKYCPFYYRNYSVDFSPYFLLTDFLVAKGPQCLLGIANTQTNISLKSNTFYLISLHKHLIILKWWKIIHQNCNSTYQVQTTCHLFYSLSFNQVFAYGLLISCSGFEYLYNIIDTRFCIYFRNLNRIILLGMIAFLCTLHIRHSCLTIWWHMLLLNLRSQITLSDKYKTASVTHMGCHAFMLKHKQGGYTVQNKRYLNWMPFRIGKHLATVFAQLALLYVI